MCFVHLGNPGITENVFVLGDVLSLCCPGSFVVTVFLGNGRSGESRRRGRNVEFPGN